MKSVGYKELDDSTLMGKTKKEIIEILRCAGHNFRAMEETVGQQYINVKDWEPVVHCKDCKHYTAYLYRCNLLEGLGICGENDYCSYGTLYENSKEIKTNYSLLEE